MICNVVGEGFWWQGKQCMTSTDALGHGRVAGSGCRCVPEGLQHQCFISGGIIAVASVLGSHICIPACVIGPTLGARLAANSFCGACSASLYDTCPIEQPTMA